MAGLRYGIALVFLMVIPGGITYWFWIHPFIRFWRRLGPTLTLVLNFALLVLWASLVFHWRATLLPVQSGANPVFIAVGVPLLVLTIGIRIRLLKQLTPKALIGLPEIAPDRFPPRLVTGGIYSRIRHPRYVEIFLVTLGFALIANYLAVYLAAVLVTAELYLIVLLEEKELRARFGSEYDTYAKNVPRFIPKLRRGRSG